MTTKRPVRGHVTMSWGLLDQIVASGSNFLYMIIAARALLPAEFGAVAFAFELYVLSVFAARGMASDPLTSRFAGLSHEDLRQPTRRGATTALVIAVVVGLVTAFAAIWLDSPLADVFVVAALALPGLTLQDYVRNALIVDGRARATFLNDTLWAVIQLPALWFAVSFHPSAAAVFGAWAATGCLAGIVGLIQLRCGPAPLREVRAWLAETRDIWPYFTADNLLFATTSLIVVTITSATAGLVGLAGFRVAMTVHAPLTTVGRGVMSVAIAMLARGRDDPPRLRRAAILISWILTPLPIAWGTAWLFVPSSVGEALFGQSWHEAEPLVFWASFVCAAALFSAGAVTGIRALSAGREALAGRVATSIVAGAFAGVGGLQGGVYGMFVALAIAFPFQSALWWYALRHAAQHAARPVPVEPATETA